MDTILKNTIKAAHEIRTDTGKRTLAQIGLKMNFKYGLDIKNIQSIIANDGAMAP